MSRKEGSEEVLIGRSIWILVIREGVVLAPGRRYLYKLLKELR